MSHQRIGELLTGDGTVSDDQLEFALALQAVSGKQSRTGEVLVEQGFSDKALVAHALAVQAGWPFYADTYVPDRKIVVDIGLAFFQEHSVFPLMTQGFPSFVMPDGDNTKATDYLRVRFGQHVCFLVGIESDILTAISLLDYPCVAAHQGAGTDVRQILEDAALKGATDIHIEPSASTVNVRLRLDGVLHFYRAFPKCDLSRIVNIFFNRSGISAGDFLRFHDARFEEECAGNKLDVRLSHIPSMNGSSLVLRLLNKSRTAVPLSQLGYSRENQRALAQAVKRPHGLILFTGPTGCGKTTSLYSLLGAMKGLPVKVVSAEDPVEVQLPLVTQVPVDLRRDQDFHHITRALLRHDPDIILIGEIRDEKTAREAVRAAVTGHRVLATLHTNNVAGAILRLKDLGIDYAQLGHTLTCIVAQRLLRLLCHRCKSPSGNDNEYLPVGCPLCHGGFKGRTVAAEVMYIDEELRLLVEKGNIQEILLEYMSRQDVFTMNESAARLIQSGAVSRCEIERVFG